MRKIIDDIKVLKANHKSLREFAKNKYVDDEGVANIHIYVDSIDIYDPMTDPKNPSLSDEIINHIEKESYYIPTDYPIRVVLHSSKDLDEADIEKKLKEHYWKEVADKDDDLKTNMFISIVLFVIGLVFLSAFFILQSIPNTTDLFNEIFSIVGSFSIWESVDYFLLNRGALRVEYLNRAQLALLSIKVSDNEK